MPKSDPISKTRFIGKKWFKIVCSFLLGILIFFSFPLSVEASDSGRIILHNLTGKPGEVAEMVEADLIFSIQGLNRNTLNDSKNLEAFIEINEEKIENLYLIDSRDKNIHYIFVLQSQSEEILRQVLTFVDQQDEKDSFSLAGFDQKKGDTQQGLSKKQFGQQLLDYFYSEPPDSCFTDQIVQAVMLARQSQKELQAILLIRDEDIDKNDQCVFDLPTEFGNINKQPFFTIPIYDLSLNENQIDEQIFGLLKDSTGESFQVEEQEISAFLGVIAKEMHSKFLIRFETKIDNAIKKLELSISNGEKDAGLLLYFTWEDLGRLFGVSIEESSKDLSITNLSNSSVQLPRTVFNLLKYFSAALIPVSVIGIFCLTSFLKKEKYGEKGYRQKQKYSDLTWYDLNDDVNEKNASIRILQSEAEYLIGRLILLNPSRTSIGRSSKNDIALVEDKYLLEHQVVLTQKSGYVTIEENSKAGFASNMDTPTFASYLNNSRLSEQPVMLNDGDIIRLGPTVVLEFRYN